MAHNVTEVQQRLIDLKYLPPLKADGKSAADGTFGTDTLAAYNRFRASKGEPPHTGLLLLVEVSADVFPEDAPPPKPVSNPFDNPLVKIGVNIFLNQALKGIPIVNILTGYKTYIVGIACILTGVIAMLGWAVPPLPALDAGQGWQLVLTGLGFMGLRAATGAAATK